jgi:phosphotriesterase-related protein
MGSPTSIPTYTGDIAPGDFGETLLHEHIFVQQPEVDRALPGDEWDEQGMLATAQNVLDGLYDRGVRTVVDLTVPGLGRDVALVRRVAEASRVRLVAATGWYAHDVLPPFFRLNGPGRIVDGPDPLVQLFIDDLTAGMQGTDVRAAAIKVVSDAEGITPDGQRIFEAAAIAHQETGAPIFTHSHAPTRGGLEQQRMLQKSGVPLDRVVIGHAGDSEDVDYLVELAAEGSWIGFDRFGMTHAGSDETRIRVLRQLIERGWEEHIVLSHDAAIYSRVTPPSWRRMHAPDWHMHHLHDDVLPGLRRDGVSESTIRTMMVSTPRRVLAGMESRNA